MSTERGLVTKGLQVGLERQLRKSSMTVGFDLAEP